MTAGNMNDTLNLETACISRTSAHGSSGCIEWYKRCRIHIDHSRARTPAVTKSNQFDAETILQKHYKATIPVLPSIELDVATATSHAHAATVLPCISSEPSTIESDDNVTATSVKAVSGLSLHNTDTLVSTIPARKSGRPRLAPAWQADHVVK